jgi:WD40 repeat protein
MQEEEKQVLTSEEGEGESPEIYQVHRDLDRWKFSRRDLLAAAGTSAAAVAAGMLAGCEAPTPEVITQVVTSGPPGVITRVVTPGPAGSPFASGDLSPEELLAACGGLKAHQDEIYALAVTPDGKLLVSGGQNEILKVWSLPQRALMSAVGGAGPIWDVVVKPDSSHVAVARSRKAEARSLPDGDLSAELDLPNEQYLALALSHDGELLALSTADHNIYLWSMAEGKQVAALAGHGVTVGSLAITPDGSRLISGAEDGQVGLWTLPDGQNTSSLSIHSSFIGGLAVNPDGTLLASGGADKTIRLSSLPGGELLAELDGHRDTVTDLAIAHDGSLLASCSVDGTIRLWSLPNGEDVGVLEHGGEVYKVALSPDGTWLASAGADGTIKFWTLPGGEFAACAIDPDANGGEVEVVTYEVVIESGERVEYTQPAGFPIPAGVVCVCNTVSGGLPSCSCVGHSSCSCVGHSVPSGGHYWYPC